MDKEELQFRADGSVDASSVIIEDFAGDQMVKIFPYYLPNTKRGIQFLQSNATSLVYYTQEGLDDDELKTDENGNVYFEVLPSMTTATQPITMAGINQDDDELSEVKAFSCLTNVWPKKMRSNLTVGQFDLIPMVFTIGRPLNEAAWNANLQPVFIATSTIAAKDSESDLAYEVQEDGIIEASFGNLFTLKQQFRNCTIQFIQLDTNKANSASIIIPSNSLFGGAFAKTLQDGVEEPVSFTEAKQYPIWNAAPITIDNRLEMFMKWEDTKLVLPLHIIKKFKTEQPLSKLFKDDADAWLTDGEALYTLLKDMLLYTQMYVNGWNDIQAADKLGDPNNSNYGTIKINVTIGSKNAPATYQAGKKVINLIINKQPAEIVETLFESFLRENPNVNQNTLAIFKASVVALSRYIRTGNLSLGGGLNDFNSIYLPWRLKSANKFNITREDIGNPIAEHNYSLKEDPEIVFDSHWYEFDGADIKPKKIKNLYETQLIKSERNITQPLIPMELSETDLSSNPGGVNINSDNELRYNWWIPTTDPKVLNSLMLDSLNVTVTDPENQLLNDKTAVITDPTVIETIQTFDKLLAGKTLAATWDVETDEIKAIFKKWYEDNVQKFEGSGFWNFLGNLLGALGPAQKIQETQDKIIEATGYKKDELATFGITGVNWLASVDGSDGQAHIVWNFMKVIQDAFDRTGFSTINHKDQWNGNTFSGNGLTSLTYPVDNWMREIKSSWLNKYLSDEPGLRAFLFDQAVALLTAFNHPSHDFREHVIPEATFLKYFSKLKGTMIFTSFKLSISGYINGNYTGDREGNLFENPLVPMKTKLKLERAQAIVKVEIIEKIPVIYPSSVHYTLKSGISQTFDLSSDRKLIYTKDEWHSLMRAIKPSNSNEVIELKPIRGENLGEIKELDVFALWANTLTINLDGTNISIDTINSYDEKIVKQKIIFT